MAPDPDFVWLQPSFGVIATAIAAFIVVWFVIVGLFAPKRPAARLRSFHRRLGRQVIGAALVVVAVATSRGLDERDVGIAWPSGNHLSGTWTFTASALLVIVLGGLVFRRRALDGRSVPGQSAFSVMLPTNSVERRLAAAVAIGAGVSEELIFRGFLIAAGVDLLGSRVVPAALLSSLVFGWAHRYQGWKAMLEIGFLGLVFCGLYLATASLLMPMLIHVAMDLRGLVLVPKQRSGARDRTH